MTKLSKRVEKADKLIFRTIPGAKTTTGGTTGSKGGHYVVSLCQKKDWEYVAVADETMSAVVITTCCQQNDPGTKSDTWPMVACKGNCQHTICYHSLGFLKQTLDTRGKHISYYENIFDAFSGLNFGGQLTKVISKQGDGYVWAVVRDKPVPVTKNLDNKATRLMRGDDEGID